MKTQVHYSAVLSATDGRMVSISGMDGIYEVFDAVAGPGVTTLALMFLSDPVKKYLLERFPKYATVTQALDTALDEWRKAYPSEESRKASAANSMKPYLDKHVLPLVGDEYVEVEHMGDAAVNKLGKEYPDFLNKTLKGKEVIAVVAPES